MIFIQIQTEDIQENNDEKEEQEYMYKKKSQKNKKITALKDMILRTDSINGMSIMNNVQDDIAPKRLFRITILHFHNELADDENGNL